MYKHFKVSSRLRSNSKIYSSSEAKRSREVNIEVFKKRLKDQSGIALMIVLSMITLFTFLATQFAYTTNVNYSLAFNEKERMQAFFLAESAVNLMKLELKLEKQFRNKMSSSAAASAMAGNMSGPMCQTFPLSTALIRSMFLGDTSATGEGEDTGEAGEEAAFISGLQVESAEEFLTFEGDFEGMCEDESSKFNLNMFHGLNPLQEMLSGYNLYDQYKLLLVSLLSRPEYENLFPEDKDKKISEISRNIADWVDENNRMNELGATTTGSEDSLYKAGVSDYDVKNGKFLTLDEIFMVADVLDSWFLPIKNMFTVYGDNKINVCLASDEIVAALIVQYANSNPQVADVNPADKERLTTLVNVVKSSCTGAKPNVNTISNALNAALGGGTASTSSSPSTPGRSGGSSSSTNNFSSLITTESRYYTLVGTGVVGDTEVNIKTVLDTRSSNPKDWQYVYWKVE